MGERIRRVWRASVPALWAVVPMALAYGATRWGIALCELSPEQSHPFWLWPVAIGCGYAYRRFAAIQQRRARRFALAYALVFIFFQLLGRQYDFARQTDSGVTAGDWTVWLKCLGESALLAPVLAWPLGELLGWLRRRAATSGKSAGNAGLRRFFLVCVAVLMVMWQPYHWAYYPGLVEYDSGYQLWQSWNSLYNASNPLLHTFILGRFYLIGEKIASASGGIAVFCFVQRLFCAGCVGYALTTLLRNRAPRPWLVLALLFFGALPVFPMLAISCTKDVPFYAMVLVQMSMIFDGCRNLERVRRRRYWIALGAVTTVACLFRANALVAMFAIAPLICWACRNRELRRLLAGVMVVGVAVAWCVNALLVAATHAEKPLLRESLSLPILQLARVDYYHEDVDEDLKQNHAALVQTPLTYIPHVADLSKWAFTVDGGNLGEFASVWTKYLKRYPGDYLDAFLLLTKGYWYIGDTTYARVYGDAPEQRCGAIPSRVSPDIDSIVEDCRLPGFKAHLERMFSTNDYLGIPVYRLLLCPALYSWLLLFCLLAAIEAGRWDVRLIARHGALYLAALLLGPCCILRYALLFMLLVPVAIGMLLTSPEGIIDPRAEVRPPGRKR